MTTVCFVYVAAGLHADQCGNEMQNRIFYLPVNQF